MHGQWTVQAEPPLKNESGGCEINHLRDLKKPAFYKPAGEKPLSGRCGLDHVGNHCELERALQHVAYHASFQQSRRKFQAQQRSITARTMACGAALTRALPGPSIKTN